MKSLLLPILFIISCSDSTTEPKDCSGVSGGTAILDECGVCNGEGIPLGKCDCEGNILDCEGSCGGNALEDECGVCDTSSENDCNNGTIGIGLYGNDLIEFLQENYKTHSTLGYNKARDTLYLNIERINGEVRGVYTNYSVSLPGMGEDPSTYLYENGINCEHIWPQSQGAGSEPMKSDMHALRACKSNVNSSRGNKPYGNIDDNDVKHWYWLDIDTDIVPTINIDSYSESAENIFEPREDRKGDIARAMFYFYTMYSDVSNESFFIEQKDILKIWHELDSANELEITRTWSIANYQEGKPNPFILDETLIFRAFFSE
tara:strand:- start:1201 stop:2154 length:954 start_codon:yes stop_codon:yes gene_type:complete